MEKKYDLYTIHPHESYADFTINYKELRIKLIFHPFHSLNLISKVRAKYYFF